MKFIKYRYLFLPSRIYYNYTPISIQIIWLNTIIEYLYPLEFYMLRDIKKMHIKKAIPENYTHDYWKSTLIDFILAKHVILKLIYI